MMTFILDLVFNFLYYVISLFPTGSGFSSEFHAGVSLLGSYLHILDPLVPITVMLSCLGLIFSVEIAIFGLKTFKWLFSHIPFIGGKGN